MSEPEALVETKTGGGPGNKLRRIKESFVVAPPAGASTRTRAHPTKAEEEALWEIGSFLHGLYAGVVSSRASLGTFDAEEFKAWRRTQKKTVSDSSSSRWAGSIVNDAMSQYRLSMMALRAEVKTRRAAVRVLEQRLAKPTVAKVMEDERKKAKTETSSKPKRARKSTGKGSKKGYWDTAERAAKARRREHQATLLAAAEARLASKAPRIVLGGRRLLITGSSDANLAAAGLTKQQWRLRWDAARCFISAPGETGKKYGNETIRVVPNLDADGDPDGTGRLEIKVPAALVHKYGVHLTLSKPVSMATHLGSDWTDRILAGDCVAYDLRFDAGKKRWYLGVSWHIEPKVTPTVAGLGSKARLGVDLNADHLAVMLLDPSGNPVGAPVTVPLALAGLSKTTRDARLRNAITEVLTCAAELQVSVIAIEDLGFQDSRDTGRETMGRGAGGKGFRRTVAGLPTAQFRNRLTAMAHRAGVWVIAVDPAYTSRWGGQHWLPALSAAPVSKSATKHHSAAVAIARRSLGYSIRRRQSRPHTGLRTSMSTSCPAPVMSAVGSRGSGPPGEGRDIESGNGCSSLGP